MRGLDDWITGHGGEDQFRCGDCGGFHDDSDDEEYDGNGAGLWNVDCARRQMAYEMMDRDDRARERAAMDDQEQRKAVRRP